MTKPVILFVDDEPNILSGIRRMLQSKKKEWEILFAESGKEALSIMENKKIDIIISDMRMPEMDGADLLTKVKEQHPDTVRIIFSGYSEEASLMKVASITHRYLAKPCDYKEITSTISKILFVRKRLGNEKIEPLITKVQALPSPRQTYIKLIRELNSSFCNADTITDIISSDAGLSAKILQLVNSAYFGFSAEITSTKTAVSLLGLDTITAIALNAEILVIFNEYAIDDLADKISKHGMFIGKLAKEIAVIEGLPNKEVVEKTFTAGLFHDVGTLFFAGILPKNYNKCIKQANNSKTSLCKCEKEFFGATHADIGGYLLGLWGIPDDIVESVIYHHSPEELDGDKLDLITLIQISIGLAEDGLDENLIRRIEDIGAIDRIPIWQEKLNELSKKNAQT
ncbi:MAG: HDOD domain-containing protein [Alphaproteobacteria bacterium]|nr:HDOD domain-containing protein [Alphaproteobacteria bacterium]